MYVNLCNMIFCRKIFVGGLSRDTGDGMICSFLIV